MPFDLTRDELYKAAVQVVGHLLTLHGNWRAYRKLFRGNADSQPILSKVAGQFFWLLERDIKAAVFLAFRQLTDGPLSAGKPNASFHGLLRAAAGSDYPANHGDLVSLIEGIAANPTIKEHVNKYIAHLDLHLLAGRASAPDSVEILQVEDALAAARQFMNEFMKRFLHEGSFEYDEKAAVITEQIERLVSVLASGLQA
jgi:HEPN superfamily AbiU2-like protein